MKTKDELIDYHIGRMFGSAESASIKYFLETGIINSSFKIHIDRMLDEYAELRSKEVAKEFYKFMTNKYKSNRISIDSIIESDYQQFKNKDIKESFIKSESELIDYGLQITKKAIQAEEDVIKKILSEILKREPDIEDFKKCTIVRRDDILNEYFLMFDGAFVGSIKKSFIQSDQKHEFICEFIPNNKTIGDGETKLQFISNSK